MIKLILPLYVMVSKKRKFWLNFNQYNASHWTTRGAAKKAFNKKIVPILVNINKNFKQIKLIYTVYHYRSYDINNVCSIIDKFFQDAMIEAGIIDDDNYKINIETLFTTGELDSENPRCEVQIMEV